MREKEGRDLLISAAEYNDAGNRALTSKMWAVVRSCARERENQEGGEECYCIADLMSDGTTVNRWGWISAR